MVKYLNNIIEQDHRHIKRVTNSMLGFKNFNSACSIIAGVETLHMIHKGQAGTSNITKSIPVDLRSRSVVNRN